MGTSHPCLPPARGHLFGPLSPSMNRSGAPDSSRRVPRCQRPVPMTRYLTSVLAWFAISGACFAQTTWTLRNANSGDLLYDVTFGGETFVAVGTTTASGSSVTSPDGIVWTHHVSAVGGIFYSVAHGNNRFVAVGSNSASSTSAVSTDGGRTWAGGPVGIGLEFRGVAWTGDGFIAVGGTGGNAVIATSPDGASWTGGAGA